MDRHPYVLIVVCATALAAAACGSGDADAHQSAAPVVERAEPQDEFHTLAARYESRASRAQRPTLRGQLKTYGTRAVTWAAEQLVVSRDELPYAELIEVAATRADERIVRRALDASREAMARHRLAATLISMGELDAFGVLLDGLESANAYDRSDAAAIVADVVDQLPRDLEPRAIALLRAGLAADAGGVTARGYEKSLRALGAE